MGSGFPKSVGGDPPIVIDQDLAFRHPANRDALTYWRSKCAERAMPSRAALDPVEMRGFLPHVGLAEVTLSTGPAIYRIRLAGTIIEEVFGPVTGQPLEHALPPKVAARWRSLFDVALEAAAPVRATTRITHQEQTFLTAEVLMAPLSEDGLAVSMLFACVAFWTDANAPP
jgi:hypothetical protein